MELKIDVRGTPAEVLEQIARDLNDQVSHQHASTSFAVAAITYVAEELNGVALDAKVTVAGAITLSVKKPAVLAHR